MTSTLRWWLGAVGSVLTNMEGYSVREVSSMASAAASAAAAAAEFNGCA